MSFSYAILDVEEHIINNTDRFVREDTFDLNVPLIFVLKKAVCWKGLNWFSTQSTDLVIWCLYTCIKKENWEHLSKEFTQLVSYQQRKSQQNCASCYLYTHTHSRQPWNAKALMVFAFASLFQVEMHFKKWLFI